MTATFSLQGNEVALEWLADQSIEHDGECLLRRVIGTDGRSRAYVNGQAMPVQSLRQLGEMLVDVHGQMEYQSLMRRPAQRSLLDRHGGHESLVASVEQAWRSMSALREERDRMKAASQDREARLELLNYHLGELKALDLKHNEVADLAVLAAGQIVRKELDPKAQADLIEATLSEATSGARGGAA